LSVARYVNFDRVRANYVIWGIGACCPPSDCVAEAESLRAEPCEQPLCHPLLQMQVNSILGEHARVLEHDGPDQSFPAPLRDLLVLFARRA
jgi:hypothetical protein